MKIRAEDIPPHIHEIVKRLVESGHSAQIVGGAVRDLLLGQRPKDFDIITSARPPQIKSLFRRCYLIGRRFRLALVHTHRPEHHVTEVVTYRDSGDDKNNAAVLQEGSGRLLADNAYGTLDTDVWRRDFTINALYYDPIKDRIIDRVEGLEDIKKRCVRMIGPDVRQRLREDPLRAVRAVRFAVHASCDIESELARRLPEARPWLDDIPRARLGLELSKIFTSPRALGIFSGLLEHKLIDAMLPGCVLDSFVPGKAPQMLALLKDIDAKMRDDEAAQADNGEGEANAALAPFPRYLGEELRAAAFYLPLLLERCEDIGSIEKTQAAINEIYPQVLCPTERSQRGMVAAIWRNLPRIFFLRQRSMKRFVDHNFFPATWYLYRRGVRDGLWPMDKAVSSWEEFMASHRGEEVLARVHKLNKRHGESRTHAESERRYAPKASKRPLVGEGGSRRRGRGGRSRRRRGGAS